ncbi:hypothetical protein EDC04DRAFT_2571549, partial [Pisolithus marmoratus]
IEHRQQEHIYHDAVSVPSHRNPFPTDEMCQQFFAVLHGVVTQDITPDGIGLTLEEWGSSYPIYQTIHVGRHGRKDLLVSLAEPIWYDRARLWGQALITMSLFLGQ